MGNKKRDKKAHEKFKSWLLGFLTDLANKDKKCHQQTVDDIF